MIVRQAASVELRSVILGQPRPILLLGAGASVTSGVPLVKELIGMIAKQGYCWAHSKEFDDDSVVRSDWLPWVRSQSWHEEESDVTNQYVSHIEGLLQPRARRREFFQTRVLVGPADASSGYRDLAALVGKRRIHTILTTNFDTLAHDACRSDPTASGVIHVKTPSDAHLVSTDPAVSQVVHVHGSVDHYTDQNLTNEVAELDPGYVERLIPLLLDHPLIVVGYRGAEPSISHDLLRAAAESEPGGLPHGVYWCIRESDGELHPLVDQVAGLCGSNFTLVRIDGFDELMATLNTDIPRDTTGGSSTPDIFDCQCSAATTEDLDSARIENSLGSSALKRLSLERDIHAGTSVLERLQLLRLAAGESITNAAAILFGRHSPIHATGHVHGMAFDVRGNIFDVYEELSAIVTESNSTYRLKGPQSIETRPIPQLAIKELLVNALGHRDYEIARPIELTFDRDALLVANPGGLADPYTAADLGRVGFKHYRNPLIAEVLYAAGLMDKYGSGLVDVARWAAEGGAAAHFEVPSDNTTFTAIVESRPDSRAGDELVSTEGRYEVFYVNALPVSLPEVVWIAPTRVRSAKQIIDSHTGRRVPPFALDGSLLITLSDLSSDSNPLRENVESPESHELGEWCLSPARERKLVEILNRSLQRHLARDEIVVWMRRSRAWFRTNDDGTDRHISYRARTRTARRTVTRLRNAQGRYPYHEHQAMNWAFVRSEDDWVLTIDPTWTFTHDGGFDLVGRRRHSRLATRKMGNERNQTVLNHVFFWAWVLCGEQRQIELDDGGGGLVVHHDPLRLEDASSPPLIGTGDDDEPDPEDVEEVQDISHVDPDDVDENDVAENLDKDGNDDAI